MAIFTVINAKKNGRSKESRTSKRQCMCHTQRSLPGFESPFEQHLDTENRWVLMSQQIQWDNLVKIYESTLFAYILMVLNLVKLAWAAPYFLYKNYQAKIYSFLMNIYFLFNQKSLSYGASPK